MCPTFPLVPGPAPLFGEQDLEPVATLSEQERAYLTQIEQADSLDEFEDLELGEPARESAASDEWEGEIPTPHPSALEWGEDEAPLAEADLDDFESSGSGVNAAYADADTEQSIAPDLRQLEERGDPMAMAVGELDSWATPELTGSWVEDEDFFPDFVKVIFRKPTVGFEFDVHYGPIPRLPDARIGDTLSTGSAAADGFKVKLDGPRLEVNTKPFETTADGRREVEDTAARIATFAEELHSKCGAVGPGVGFTHSTLSVPVGKLPTGTRTPNCGVWAAPQATITVKLSRISALVDKIPVSYTHLTLPTN